MKLNELVEKYIVLRDRRAERKRAYEEADAADVALQEKIEAVLLKTFDENGMDSVKTANGTAYKSTRNSATVGDRDAYINWVLEDPQERQVFLESRCNKSAVEQYKAANDELPPGINWRSELVVNVRRSA